MDAEEPVLNVLIADDHADSAESLAALLEMLSDSPLRTFVAFDGQQAIAHAQRMDALASSFWISRCR